MNMQASCAKAEQMSEQDIALRLRTYNPDGALERALAEAWSVAGPGSSSKAARNAKR